MKKSLLLTFISAMLLGGAISASEYFENSLATYIKTLKEANIKEISITYGNTTTSYKNIKNYQNRVNDDLKSFFNQDIITDLSDKEKQEYFNKLSSHINVVESIKNENYDKYNFLCCLANKRRTLYSTHQNLFPNISQEDLNQHVNYIIQQALSYLPNNSSNNNTTNTYYSSSSNPESSPISNITNSNTENSRTQNSQKESQTKEKIKPEPKIELVLENNVDTENTPSNALPNWAQGILNDGFPEINENSADIDVIEFKGLLETKLKKIFNNNKIIYQQTQAIKNLENNEDIQHYLKIEHLCHAFIAVKKDVLIYLYKNNNPPQNTSILEKEDYGKELLEKYGHTYNQDNNHENDSDPSEKKVVHKHEYTSDENSESSENNSLSIGKISIFATLFIALTGWAYFSGRFSSVTDYFKNKLGFPTNIE